MATGVNGGTDKRPSSGIRVKRETSSGTLEIFHNGDLEKKQANTSNKTRSKAKAAPRPDSRDSQGRTTPVSSRQVSLQTIKRKNEESELIVEDIEVTDKESEKTLNERLDRLSLNGRSSRLFNVTSSKDPSPSHISKPDDRSENECSSDSEEEEDVIHKAPNELFMEFLTCIMNKDYVTAKKLCRMILIYEPNHQEALNFQKLIDEKILLDQEPDESDSDEERESGHELDSDTEDDDDDSDDSSFDESSDSSSDDEGSSTRNTTDSGITSNSLSD